MQISVLRWRHLGACFVLAASGLLLAACGGASGADGADGTTGANGTSGVAMLIRTTAEAAGSNCADGGTRIDSGPDTNGDGGLSAGETTSTQFVCNAANGTNGFSTLVSMTNEPAGTNCAAGGKRIAAGTDVNGNGVLDASEVSTTSDVCNGVAGTTGANGTNGTNGLNSLIAIVAETAGPNCATGGNKITSGLDSNTNGVLDAGEVTSTRYQCDGATGAAGAPFPWVDAPVDAQAVSNTGYLADSSAMVSITLPASPAVGDTVRVSGVGSGGWTIAQQGSQSIITVGVPLAPMGTQWTQHGPTDSWRAIASSASGIKLAAIDQSHALYTSTDGGQTWTQQGTGFAFGAEIVSSADGNTLLATPYGTDSLLLSNDAGQNWYSFMSVSDWRAIAMSADGNTIFAVDSSQQVWSSYYGGNISPQATLPGITTAMACSADCSRMVAVNSTGEILTSEQSAGASFNPAYLPSINADFEAVTMSADGSRVLAVGPGYIVGTSDFFTGAWYSNGTWTSVASSADGLHVLLAAPNSLQVSLDGAQTWTTRTPPSSTWTAVAMSSDGSRLIAADGAAISTSVSTTTPGSAGSISGSQYGAIELQYVGNENFAILSSNGVLVAN
jgi:hypothetical protein